jgi:hypothetical protein
MIKLDDTIVAFDFEPMNDRTDRFAVGYVKTIKEYSYIVEVLIDTLDPRNPRKEIEVPRATLFEFKNRIMMWEDYKLTYYKNFE